MLSRKFNLMGMSTVKKFISTASAKIIIFYSFFFVKTILFMLISHLLWKKRKCLSASGLSHDVVNFV